jgi:hypothetical protein
MGAPDNQLPVFSFRPNWGNGILERLDWMTDVLDSPSGAEQRNALRLSPRRSFEAQIDALAAERTFLDLFGRRFGAGEFMLPLWHDNGILTAGAAIAASSLAVDTIDREFVASGMALLMGADAFTCEAVQIATVASGSLTLSVPTVAAWPAGTSIHPLRRARFSDDPKLTLQTDRFSRSTMTFLLSGSQVYDGGSEELVTFGGYPILAPAPDWSSRLDLEFGRNLPAADGKVGLRSVVDTAGRAFSTQMHRWMLVGRPDQSAFRRLLYRLRGKQAPIWLPTFGGDLRIAATAAPGATHIDVAQCGLAYGGFPAAGRQHAITADGEALTLTTLATSPGPGVERINLSAPLAGALAVGDRLSFMDIGRLDSDAIEIHHETDSDGVATIEAPFRTFPDIRDGSADGFVPLPTATEAGSPCFDCPLPFTSFPFEAEATFPSPLPAYDISEQRAAFKVPLYCYVAGICTPISISINMIAAGPQVTVDANGCVTSAFCACGTIGNPISTFDVTYPIMMGGYELAGRFYYDGTKMGCVISNPGNHPVYVITQMEPSLDYTLPLYGTPAMTLTGAALYDWLAIANVYGTIDTGWSETIAFAHDFNITIKANGTVISRPYQRSGNANSTYSSAYIIEAFAGIGSTNTSEFAPCHLSAGGSFPGPCA